MDPHWLSPKPNAVYCHYTQMPTLYSMHRVSAISIIVVSPLANILSMILLSLPSQNIGLILPISSLFHTRLANELALVLLFHFLLGCIFLFGSFRISRNMYVPYLLILVRGQLECPIHF